MFRVFPFNTCWIHLIATAKKDIFKKTCRICVTLCCCCLLLVVFQPQQPRHHLRIHWKLQGFKIQKLVLFFVSKWPTETSWWFQPIWKILVKLDHFPQVEVKIKQIWNHQLENKGLSKKRNQPNIHLKTANCCTSFWHRGTGLKPASQLSSTWAFTCTWRFSVHNFGEKRKHTVSVHGPWDER